MTFTASSCCLLVSSLLLLGAAQATFHHQDKNDKNNGEEPLENEARTYLEARHSPFHVRSSKELNRALAILEHESQSWYARDNGDGDRWWADDDGRDNGHKHKNGDNSDATARGQRDNNDNKNKKHNQKDEERDYIYGRIQIEKTGDYYLDRDFIFSDGFKLEITGGHGEPKHHHHHDKHHHHEEKEKKEKGEEVVIHAAPNKRHFTFDDFAILKACDLTFVDGGCDKEGFYGGSMLFVNRATGKFEDVHFRDNTAWVGGAVYAESARWLDFHRGSFEHNHADRKGGAVAIEEERAQNNKKKNHHGRERGVGSARDNDKKDKYNKRALYHDNGDNDNDAFGSNNNDNNDNKNKNRKNKKRGRRITRVHFNKVTFTNNKADLGGAVFNGGSRTDAEDSHFAHNHARLGGAVYNNHRGRLLIRESSFYANEASAKGGAIFNAGRVWIVCSRFQDNEAPVGCDIFNNGDLKCSASTDHVKIDGSGEGYCHACVQPATAGPTMKSTPKRRVKKDDNEDKKDKDHHDKDGGLVGGLFGKNGKDGKGDDESRFVYAYYQHGDSTAFDRWNGDYNAWDAEEADAHKDYAH